jgi:hypothetical protein
VCINFEWWCVSLGRGFVSAKAAQVQGFVQAKVSLTPRLSVGFAQHRSFVNVNLSGRSARKFAACLTLNTDVWTCAPAAAH